MGKTVDANVSSESRRFHCFLSNINTAPAVRESKMPLDFCVVINNSARGRRTDFTEFKKDKLEGGKQLIKTEPSKASSSRNKSFFSLLQKVNPKRA